MPEPIKREITLHITGDATYLLDSDEFFSEIKALSDSGNIRNEKIAYTIARIMASQDEELEKTKVVCVKAIGAFVGKFANELAKLNIDSDIIAEVLDRTISAARKEVD